MMRARYTLPLLLLLPLLTVPHAGAGATSSWYVIAAGPLAGARLTAGPDREVPPDGNLATGLRGRVLASGLGWIYVDSSGARAPVLPVAVLPEHARKLTHALSVLRAAAVFGSEQATEALPGAVAELEAAARLWREAAPAPDADTWQAQGDLDALAAAIRQAATAESLAGVRDSLPALHRVAAMALSPRDDVTVQVSPTTIDFGEVPIGSTVSDGIAVSTNAKDGTTVGVDASGLAAPFSAPGAASIHATSAYVSHVYVNFTPTATGDFTGQVVVTHASLPGGRAVVQVKGKGVQAKLLATPNPLDFGKVHIKSFKTIGLSVTNSSPNKAEVTVTLNLKKPFSHEAIGTINGSYNPNQTSTMNVSFSPKKAGKFTGSITLKTSEGVGTITVPVTGEGVGDISVSSTSIEFGAVNVNTSNSQQITVTNTTDQPVTLGITGVGGAFSIPNAPTTIPANGSVNLDVKFDPTKSGFQSDHVTIESTGPGGKFSVPIYLAGNAVLPVLTGVSILPTDVNFGTVPHGQTVQRTFTVKNTGNAATTVNLDQSYLPHEFFQVIGDFSFTLQPGADHTVTISFEANRACKHKGKILVTAASGSAAVTVEATSQ